MITDLTQSEVLELLTYLEPHEIAEIDQLLAMGPTRSIEAESLTAFKQALYKRYIHAQHLEALDRELMAVTRYIETGGAEGTWLLIVAMPPRRESSSKPAAS